MVSLIGIAVLFILAILLSAHRKSINWRTVGGAFAIQAIIGALVLYFPPGKDFLLGLTVYVKNIIEYSQQGIDFIFGQLGNKSLGFIFAFNVLPVIVFFVINHRPLSFGYHVLDYPFNRRILAVRT